MEQGKAKEILQTLLINFGTAITGCAYVFYQMLTIDFIYWNPFVMVSNSIVGIVCCVIIKQAIGETGFIKGKKDDVYRGNVESYNDTCNEALPYIDRVDNFYAQEEIELKKKNRQLRLQGVKLYYNHWFNDKGEYIGKEEEYQKLSRRQKKALDKCVNLRVYVLNLFGEYSTDIRSCERKERTEQTQRTGSMFKNLFSAFVVSIMNVFWEFSMNGWEWSTFIAGVMQVALWIMLGLLQALSNKSFIVNDKVSILRRKKELIIKFVNGCEQGKYKTNPYLYNESEVETNGRSENQSFDTRTERTFENKDSVIVAR